MVSKLKSWVNAHPRLSAWIALAIGMVIVLIIAARDVGLLWNQWLFLILATIGLAGLCVWIISWESNEEEADNPSNTVTPSPAAPQDTGGQASKKG
ncbi:MAG: hypothetical protein RMN25_13315 [Anaerolineae bacterium]|nr:hypothetical protein [Thermoflexales bacterium]MDW8408753.1 hypothetical protein [Anaerolineae bacterium]